MKILFIIFTIWLIVGFLTTDSTDNGFIKSGLGFYIDNATGCHYLSGGVFGGITPRLDKNGEHVCGGWEEERKLKNMNTK